MLCSMSTKEATLPKSLAFAVAVHCAGCAGVGGGGAEPDVGWKIEN